MSFTGHTTKTIANMLPDGKAFESKNIPDNNLYKFLDAVAQSFILFNNDLNDALVEMNISTTEDLISRWEREYGLPDDCLPTASTLEERINNILIKIGINGIQTVQDYIDLFSQFGYPIEIENFSDGAVYPFDVYGYPITLSDVVFNKFTIIVRLPQAFQEEVYDFSTNGYPIILLDVLPTTFIECLFFKVVPANVNIIFQYVL